MTKRMLIDASHAEETRVVVLDGNRLEDFDVETSTKRQLKGNIYLAKVVRVEPSLQAAFVEYGGNRHGFLAFSEIHPDYYQIPVADRQRLIEMEAEEARLEEEEADLQAALEQGAGQPPGMGRSQPQAMARQPAARSAMRPGNNNVGPHGVAPDAGLPAGLDSDDGQAWARAGTPRLFARPAAASERPAVPDPSSDDRSTRPRRDASSWQAPTASDVDDEASWAHAATPRLLARDAEAPPATSLTDQSGSAQDHLRDPRSQDWHPEDMNGSTSAFPHSNAAALNSDEAPQDGSSLEAANDDGSDQDGMESFDSSSEAPPETMGGDHDAPEESNERRLPSRFLRNYRIQEVIRRRQILLVQVVKEERGTKGAALTTYLSLAGRFGVLMPNSPRGGGISRKITSATDRRRLKEVMAELDIPRGMGMIVRTAGAQRPKPEIKRDCEYLLRLWDDIREHTLKSIAPALIYEEASLIKRSIRDVYSRDIDEIIVDGEDGWKAAHDFMRMLMPSHARKVVLWSDGGQPLFAKSQVETQLEAMLQPIVQLRSGGYLVINQTEALVAIDVNSGRSTRERNIEETALRTNLEAADEVARQLRLRDLAGLIVIDFIDMESKRHNAMVERRLKDALKDDRARIQIGSISHFGLLEMSRQRLRPSLAETSFILCPHCGGTGHVRSTENAAIHVLRGIEDEGSRRRAAEVIVHLATPVALYLLNHKRDRIREIETRYEMRVVIAADDTQIAPAFRIERVRAADVMAGPVFVTQEQSRLAPPAPVTAPAPMPVSAPQPAQMVATVAQPSGPSQGYGAGATAEPSMPVQTRPMSPVADQDDMDDSDSADTESDTDDAADETRPPDSDNAAEADRRRKRRRRRRRGGRREEGATTPDEATGTDISPDGIEPDSQTDAVRAEAHAPGDGSLDAASFDSASASGSAPAGHRPAEPAVPDAANDPRAESAVAPSEAETEGGPDAMAGPASEEEFRGRKRPRRGGRRRRREGETEIPLFGMPGADQPDIPATYTGPTPANPFGGEVFDIFDVMERAERSAGASSEPVREPVGGVEPLKIDAIDAPSVVARMGPSSLTPGSEPTPEPAGGALDREGPGTTPQDNGAQDTHPEGYGRSGNGAPTGRVEAGQVEGDAFDASSVGQPTTSVPSPGALAEPASPGIAEGAGDPNAAGRAVAMTQTAATPASAAANLLDAAAEPEAAGHAAEAHSEPVVKPILIGGNDAPAPEKKRGWWRR